MVTRSILALAVVAGLAACGPKVSSIDVSPASITMTKKGEAARLRVTPKDKEGREVQGLTATFTSSVPAVAAVDQAGAVTAASNGDAVVTVAFGEQATFTVPVKVMVPASISVSQQALNLVGAGTKVALTAKVLGEKGEELPLDVEWKSESPEIVTVKGGEVTAVAVGEAKVVASAGEAKAEVAVTVAAPAIDKIEVTNAALELQVGAAPAMLVPVAKDAAGNAVQAAFTFASGDEKVATVNESGEVTAKAKGKTQVTITSGEKSFAVEVAVK